jgi:hypothetical protein
MRCPLLTPTFSTGRVWHWQGPAPALLYFSIGQYEDNRVTTQAAMHNSRLINARTQCLDTQTLSTNENYWKIEFRCTKLKSSWLYHILSSSGDVAPPCTVTTDLKWVNFFSWNRSCWVHKNHKFMLIWTYKLAFPTKCILK